jgi:Ni,Fe-hydrogenase I small subunit
MAKFVYVCTNPACYRFKIETTVNIQHNQNCISCGKQLTFLRAEYSEKENVASGAFGGAVIGAVVGGVPGAIIGAIVGSAVGQTIAEKEKKKRQFEGWL